LKNITERFEMLLFNYGSIALIPEANTASILMGASFFLLGMNMDKLYEARIETWAKHQKIRYNSLRKEGFSHGDAIQIVAGYHPG
jgi:hypothetical protein